MIANPSMTSSSNECEELLRCLRGLVRHLSLLVRGGEPSPSSPLKPSSARFCFSWLSWCALSLRLVRFRGLLGSVSISTSNGALPTHKSPHTHLQALSLLFQFGLHKYSHRFSTIQQNISTSKTPMRSTIVQMAEHTIWPHYAQPSRISSRASQPNVVRCWFFNSLNCSGSENQLTENIHRISLSTQLHSPESVQLELKYFLFEYV